MGRLIDEYYEKKPGPIGSKDRKRPVVAANSLFATLNEESSEIAFLWDEKDVSDWVKTLGGECGACTQSV